MSQTQIEPTQKQILLAQLIITAMPGIAQSSRPGNVEYVHISNGSSTRPYNTQHPHEYKQLAKTIAVADNKLLISIDNEHLRAAFEKALRPSGMKDARGTVHPHGFVVDLNKPEQYEALVQFAFTRIAARHRADIATHATAIKFTTEHASAAMDNFATLRRDIAATLEVPVAATYEETKTATDETIANAVKTLSMASRRQRG